MCIVVYPHSARALNIFKARFMRDNRINDQFTYQASAARDSVANDDPLCKDWSAYYNSQVDLLLQGDTYGEIDGYYYNRLDLSDIIPSDMRVFMGSSTDVNGLMDEINRQLGTVFSAGDLVNGSLLGYVNDCQCEGSFGQVTISLTANPASLIERGSQTSMLLSEAISLPQVLTNPFVGLFQSPV